MALTQTQSRPGTSGKTPTDPLWKRFLARTGMSIKRYGRPVFTIVGVAVLTVGVGLVGALIQSSNDDMRVQHATDLAYQRGLADGRAQAPTQAAPAQPSQSLVIVTFTVCHVDQQPGSGYHLIRGVQGYNEPVSLSLNNKGYEEMGGVQPGNVMQMQIRSSDGQLMMWRVSDRSVNLQPCSGTA